LIEGRDDIGFFGGYRVAAVLLNEGKILLFTEELIDCWVLPGGGIKIFESSEEAIKREFKEETGISIKVERLLWIVENSFEMDGLKYHALELTFLVSPMDSLEKLTKKEFKGLEDDLGMVTNMEGRYKDKKELELVFRWFKPEELDSITIKPDIYNEALKNIPEYPTLLRNLEIKKDD
jgi:8-oxo-dGTP pyrophosphatase MutT (NUDIX family)